MLDENVATIDANGLATGIAPGTTLVVIEFAGVSCLDTNECATLTVADVVPPEITAAAPSVSVLWPPNHQMVDVSVAATAVDNVDPAPVCVVSSVASNEPVNGLGDGDAAPDWRLSGGLALQLRAERGGRGGGRVYTIAITCSDASGNSSTTNVAVSVPHDRRR